MEQAAEERRRESGGRKRRKVEKPEPRKRRVWGAVFFPNPTKKLLSFQTGSRPGEETAPPVNSLKGTRVGFAWFAVSALSKGFPPTLNRKHSGDIRKGCVKKTSPDLSRVRKLF